MFNNTTSSPNQSFSTPCGSNDYYFICTAPAVSFSTSIIIAVLSPVAVVVNALILSAIWKKTFVRTPFHVLLSGLAFTDLCTGLIAQPFYAATNFMVLANPSWVTNDEPKLIVVMRTISKCSAIYFIAITVLLITLTSIERWLYMSRRSMVTSHRGYFTGTILLFIPIPIVVCRIYRRFWSVTDIMIITLLISCLLITSFAYFKVFRIIRRHQQQVQANETSRNFGQSAIDMAKYKKSVASMLYILLLFSVCFFPRIVFSGVRLSIGYSSEIYVVDKVSTLLLFLSSSLNPGLYLWRMSDIRIGVKQILCRNS